MAKQKNEKKEKKPQIVAVEEAAGFSEHKLPTEEEIKEEEIEESLMEIYQDDDGKLANVSHFDIKKRRGLVFYATVTLLSASLLGAAAFAFFKYVYQKNTNSGSVELTVNGPKEINSGEEFSYEILYRNLNNVEINDIELKANYPKNFIFLASSVAASERNDLWRLGNLGAHRSGRIEVRGKIVGQENEVNTMLASMNYFPANFSSEFRKEAVLETVTKGTGLEFTFAQQNSVLINEDTEISIKYKKNPENKLSNFRLSFANADNVVFATSTEQKEGIEVIKPGVWDFKELKEEDELKIKFKFKDKRTDSEELVLNLEYKEGDNYYKILEKKMPYEIIRNELNLNMILNGSRNDQGIDFGKTLNYSIVYANKGEEEMKDVVIMAVLNSEILNWSSLEDANKGKLVGNSIIWSKEEIPALSSLKKGDEGTVDFSIDVLSLEKARARVGQDKKYEVQGYAQFSIGNKEMKESDNTKSNIILAIVNSDLKLKEQVRYFNDDNIAVGSGPIPPKVGETTGLKVDWKLTNNLHELNSLKVETVLPSGVEWDAKNRTTVGTISYDETSRKVTWDIGRLPMDVYEVLAEFNIKITPTESNRDKIMVLLSGTEVYAVDTVTNSEIKKTGGAKTTKLEDDDIADTEGGLIR